MKDILYPTPLHYTRPSTISLCWRPFSFHPNRTEEPTFISLRRARNGNVDCFKKLGGNNYLEDWKKGLKYILLQALRKAYEKVSD
ncbi:MAG: hypothetical protein DRI83_09825 [Bacteroidetes bacterium]|nr:MAG: hypothetical protein DRI83_09825 [Bacteroidota bacterium]